MPKIHVADDFTMQRGSDATLGLDASVPSLPGSSAASRPLVDLGPGGLLGKLRGFTSRLTDAQLALAVGAVLFAISAWPLALTEVPPYQDLPNHLAAVTVIDHPERYPEFVSNGFLKTNAALFTWLFFVGKLVGAKVAAKLFALVVLAGNALALPRFVLEMTKSRKKLVIASFFAWPMVHNWFVSMGMLDFALGIPLGLATLMLLNRQRTAPSLANALLTAAAAALTWYAHVFVLMVVHLLVLVHIVLPARLGGAGFWSKRASGVRERPSAAERWREAKALILPLVPTTLLTLYSIYQHVTEPAGLMTGFVDTGKDLPPWELVYNMFAEWSYGFTWLSITALVPCLVLGFIGLWRRDEKVPFFSPIALAILAAFFLTVPYVTTNWFHVNSRFIPFIWFAFLLRVPDKLPKQLLGALGVSALLYSIGMGVDFVRLDHDRAQFTAGVSAVPEGARLLPLIFKRKLTSENTRSLQHTWGYYVMEKQTSAPLLFAHSASFPVMYREPPTPQFNHLNLGAFAASMGKSNWMCDVLRSGGVFVTDCEGAWRERWADFWRQAVPLYDHLLLWDATPEAVAQIPSDVYHRVFQTDHLAVWAKRDAVAAK